MKWLQYILALGALGSLYAAERGSDLYYGTTTDNFIIRWGFQSLCDHVYDPWKKPYANPTKKKRGVSFDPLAVKPGDIIFVRRVDQFMAKKHPKITVPYVMVTHGDFHDTVKDEDLDYLADEKIIAWFSIHPPRLCHHKYHPLPLGVSQRSKGYDQANTRLKELRELPKKKLLSTSFSDRLTSYRTDILQYFKGLPFCTVLPRLSQDAYLKEIAQCKFSVSPRGWGPDAYRTWEALLVGTIPIVKRGEYDPLDRAKGHLYKGAQGVKKELNVGTAEGLTESVKAQIDRLYENLPVLVIDDWSEITEEFLHQKYEEISSRKYDLSILYMEYWRDKIFGVRDAFLKTYYAQECKNE